PKNKYENFTNAYIYNYMVKNKKPNSDRLIVCKLVAEEWQIFRKQKEVEFDNITVQYLNTPLDMQRILYPITSHPQVSISSSFLQTAIITIAQLSENLEEFFPNAVAQNKQLKVKD
ncbi:17653_t:CDS:1, partial [Gigaspora margarita]